MREEKISLRENPTKADIAHCILYVIRASSNLSTEMSTAMKEISKIRKSQMLEGIIFILVLLRKTTISTSNIYLYSVKEQWTAAN